MKTLWAINANSIYTVTSHLGAAQPTSVFQEIFAIKVAKLLEISADLITNVSADAARMESVPNSINV